MWKSGRPWGPMHIRFAVDLTSIIVPVRLRHAGRHPESISALRSTRYNTLKPQKMLQKKTVVKKWG